jgi:hypothetical protein
MPGMAEASTTFTYTSNPLSDGGVITASVTLPCDSCPAGTYGGASLLFLSMSYGSVTLSWPNGNGSPTDPWVKLNSNGEVVDWQLQLVNDVPFPPEFHNFLLKTVNTTDPRYQRLETEDGVITGGVFDAVLFRPAPRFELHILESKVGSPGTWRRLLPDSDNDGVPDNLDQCPNTPQGIITDATGCSIDQLVPCNGPWRNHGEYIRALHDAISHFVDQGLLNHEQAIGILRRGANSNCGKK